MVNLTLPLEIEMIFGERTFSRNILLQSTHLESTLASVARNKPNPREKTVMFVQYPLDLPGLHLRLITRAIEVVKNLPAIGVKESLTKGGLSGLHKYSA